MTTFLKRLKIVGLLLCWVCAPESLSATPRLFIVPAGVEPDSVAPGVPHRLIAAGGELIDLEVWLGGAPPSVCAYQVALPCAASGGDSGMVVFSDGPESPWIDSDTTQYIFYGQSSYFPVIDNGFCDPNGTCTEGVIPAEDINSDGVVDVRDIGGVLEAWCSGGASSADIEPCGGNGIVNLDDVLAVLNSFSGDSNCETGGCSNLNSPCLRGECGLLGPRVGAALSECMSGANCASSAPFALLARFQYFVAYDAKGIFTIAVDCLPEDDCAAPRSFFLANPGQVVINGVESTPIEINVPVGTCCGAFGFCSEVTEDECALAGGIFDSIHNDCQNVCCGCFSNGDCFDGNPCTIDSCKHVSEFLCTCVSEVPNGACCNPVIGQLTPIDDHDSCTTDLCDPVTGIVSHVPSAADGTPCDFGDDCTERGTCLGGVCMAGADMFGCNDNNVCTYDSCQQGLCTNSPVGFGNVNNVGPLSQANLDDILCVLAGFGNFASCPNGDLAPMTGPMACQGNNIIELDDILAVLMAFAGGAPCNCNP